MIAFHGLISQFAFMSSQVYIRNEGPSGLVLSLPTSATLSSQQQIPPRVVNFIHLHDWWKC